MSDNPFQYDGEIPEELARLFDVAPPQKRVPQQKKKPNQLPYEILVNDALADSIGFTDADLVANFKGYMSDEQEEIIQSVMNVYLRESFLWLAIFLVPIFIWFVIAGVSIGDFISGKWMKALFDSTDLGERGVGLGVTSGEWKYLLFFGSIILSVSMYSYLKMYGLVRIDRRLGAVHFATGYIKKIVIRKNKRQPPIQQLSIGGRKLKLTQAAYDSFVDDGCYILYYLPKSHIVISAIPITKAKCREVF